MASRHSWESRRQDLNRAKIGILGSQICYRVGVEKEEVEDAAEAWRSLKSSV